MGCREFFINESSNPDKCKALQKQLPEKKLEWESQSASEHSPGPVTDEENLIRHWLNPHHFDPQTGTLNPTAFDDASNKGLSVNRAGLVTLEEIQEVAQARIDEGAISNPTRAPRQLLGYSIFTAKEARSVYVTVPTPDTRAFGVYDTAKADDLSHADVCQIASNAQGGRSARVQMRKLVNERFKRF